MRDESDKIIPFAPRRFPPKELREKAFSRVLREANSALEKYAAALSKIPFSPSLLSPLIILESIDSLGSQQIKASLKDVLKVDISPIKHRTKLYLITAHIRALQQVCKNHKKVRITKNWICDLHKIIKRKTSSKSEIGSYRKKQNWIGPAGCKIEEAYFYPPAFDQVEAMMRSLLRYFHTQQREPLLQLALIFAQFLIIHPFMDGNGRIARILIPVFLCQKKRIPFPFFFMSNYFKRHRLHYFFSLYQTTNENRWENWIHFFLKGVKVQANKGQKLLKEIAGLYQVMQQDGIDNRTLSFLFQHPVFSASYFKKAKRSKKILAQLELKKWVHRDKEGIFVFTSLFRILKK